MKDRQQIRMKTRYFKDGHGFWKFAPDLAPMTRSKSESDWAESIFISIDEFLECTKPDADITECTEEEAEP